MRCIREVDAGWPETASIPICPGMPDDRILMREEKDGGKGLPSENHQIPPMESTLFPVFPSPALPAGKRRPGTDLLIAIRDKTYPAKVVKKPYF
jgi:hypothetical protein